ncbi:MAG TPA: hypothetical protein VHT30_08985 [Acidimicrobiales bacterium]|jgi:hypothetical protein|nr:hypothetical protein [Acidimicrobiales bacterium]
MTLQDSLDFGSLPDRGLDEASLSGSRRVAWDLFVRHGSVLYALALVLAHDEALAEDAVEDVFVDLVRRDDSLVAARSDRDVRLELLVKVCRRLSVPGNDPCVARLLGVLCDASEADIARALGAPWDHLGGGRLAAGV